MQMHITVEFKERGNNYGMMNKITGMEFRGQHKKTESCHFLSPTVIYDEINGKWSTVAKQSPGYLYGPACNRTTRQLMYSCENDRCHVVCACILCRALTQGSNSAMFDRKKHFEDHQRYHHAMHVDCDFCTQLFETFPAFTYVGYIHGTFLGCNKVPYITHRMQHTERVFIVEKPLREKQVECKECDLTFKNTADKLRHDKAKHYEDKIICHLCSKVFNRKDNYERHVIQVHGGKEKELRCSDCLTEFSNDAHLKRHREAKYDEAGNISNFCNICGEKFCTLKNLKTHKKRCQIKCEDCGDRFARKSALSTHKLGGKIVCDHCGKGFCNRRKLKLHSKIHQQVMFDCDYCGKEFTKKWMLGRHQHGAVQLGCEKCNLKLCSATILRIHMMKSHKSVACANCGKFVLLKDTVVLECLECSYKNSK